MAAIIKPCPVSGTMLNAVSSLHLYITSETQELEHPISRQEETEAEEVQDCSKCHDRPI